VLTVEGVRDGSFGSFGSVPALVESVEPSLAARNLDPVRYEWKAGGKTNQEKIERARAARDAAQTRNGSLFYKRHTSGGHCGLVKILVFHPLIIHIPPRKSTLFAQEPFLSRVAYRC